MDGEIRRYHVINRLQKPNELPIPVTTMTFADDASGRDVQRGKQRRRSVAHVVMRPVLGLSGTHRHQGRGAIEGLNLTVFIDRQQQGASRRIEIQPHNVAHFVDE
jgi:hypothetical protein